MNNEVNVEVNTESIYAKVKGTPYAEDLGSLPVHPVLPMTHMLIRLIAEIMTGNLPNITNADARKAYDALLAGIGSITDINKLTTHPHPEFTDAVITDRYIDYLYSKLVLVYGTKEQLAEIATSIAEVLDNPSYVESVTKEEADEYIRVELLELEYLDNVVSSIQTVEELAANSDKDDDISSIVDNDIDDAKRVTEEIIGDINDTVNANDKRVDDFIGKYQRSSVGTGSDSGSGGVNTSDLVLGALAIAGIAYAGYKLLGNGAEEDVVVIDTSFTL